MTIHPIAIIAAAVLTACVPAPSTSERPINWDDYAFPDTGPPEPTKVMWVCTCPAAFGGDASRRDVWSPWDPCDAERWQDAVLSKVCPAFGAACNCSCGLPEPDGQGDAGVVNGCGVGK